MDKAVRGYSCPGILLYGDRAVTRIQQQRVEEVQGKGYTCGEIQYSVGGQLHLGNRERFGEGSQLW